MSFRTRKSFKLGSGVRLNLSKSGPSLSIGGRGFTRNYSAKGTRTTLGIPGTGLSSSTYSSNRTSSYGMTRAEIAEERRMKKLEDAEWEVAFHQQYMDHRLKIHKVYPIPPFDWAEASRELPEFAFPNFEHPTFNPPEKDFSKFSVALEVVKTHLCLKTILFFFLVSFIVVQFHEPAGLIGDTISAIFAFINVIYTYKAVKRLVPERLGDLETKLQDRYKEASDDYEYLKAEKLAKYESEKASALAAYEADQILRRQLRENPSNLESLGKLFDREVQRVEWPFKLYFHADFESRTDLTLHLVMPYFFYIPEDDLYVNTKNTVSKKRVSKAERADRYRDMCASISARFALEAYRMFPDVQNFRIYGYDSDFRRKQRDIEWRGMEVMFQRATFSFLDLKHKSAMSIFWDNKGKLALDKQGDVIPLSKPY